MRHLFPGRTALGVLLLLSAGCWTDARAEGDTLVPEDKIKLRVVEWRSSEGHYATSQALEGTYAVDDTGKVSIPIAGRIMAAGKSIEALSAAITAALEEKAQLPGSPFIAVEIAEHAPIFISGAVQTPGRYPFESTMTVMKAVSLAGGFRRPRGDEANFERDRIEAAGAYQTAALNQRDLLVKRARLVAEIAGKDSFDVPAEIAATPDIDRLKQDEMNLMRLRRIELQSRVKAADDLSQLYTREIDTLEAKIASQKRQIDLAQQELDTVNNLVSKGLTNNTRQFSVDRGLAEAQSRLLDLEVALTKARQSQSESEREKINIVNKQNAENQAELNTINLAIKKSSIDMQVAQLLGDQASYDTHVASLPDDQAEAGTTTRKVFKITRRNSDGSNSEIEADATTALMPHDLIDVGTAMSTQSSALPSRHRSPPAMLADRGQGRLASDQSDLMQRKQ